MFAYQIRVITMVFAYRVVLPLLTVYVTTIGLATNVKCLIHVQVIRVKIMACVHHGGVHLTTYNTNVSTK